MKKGWITMVLLVLLNLSSFGQIDKSSIIADAQLSSEGIYGGTGLAKEYVVSDRFIFKPSILYYYHLGKTNMLFQHNHLRIGGINATYVSNNIQHSFTMGTLLPIPKHDNKEEWGYNPFYSYKVERIYKHITYYSMLDFYRVGRPLVKLGVTFRVTKEDVVYDHTKYNR